MATPLARRTIVTCEHGGHDVPRDLAALFRGAKDVLTSHRGWDPGALPLARALAAALDAPREFAVVSRLVVELNRSLRHPRLFSEFTGKLDAARRRELVERYWRPYRERVERLIRDAIDAQAPVVHLSVHTFTPELDGDVRRADVGLLYDPARPLERAWCDAWIAALQARRDDLVVRRNYPYRGVADGFTTALRRRFSDAQYAGVELEVNQKWPLAGGARWCRLMADLTATIPATRADCASRGR